MGLHQDLPMYKANYDFLLEIFRYPKDFSKDISTPLSQDMEIRKFKVQRNANMNCVKNQTNFDLFYGFAEQ